jgi:succinate dehydrogenase / fumarate reductase membrane anchor subunit
VAATTSSPTVRRVAVPKTLDTWIWLFLRWSGLALIPLVWGHILLQDVIVGVHRIELDYVVWRWSFIGWQIYDIALLGFAFAHGMNGLRNVLNDYIHSEAAQRTVGWAIFIVWLVITTIGGIAIFGTRAVHEGLAFERVAEHVGFGITLGTSGTISLIVVGVVIVLIGLAFLTLRGTKK